MVSYEKSTQIIYKPLVYIPDLPFVMTKDPYAFPRAAVNLEWKTVKIGELA